jgi:hypothetical protein
MRKRRFGVDEMPVVMLMLMLIRGQETVTAPSEGYRDHVRHYNIE